MSKTGAPSSVYEFVVPNSVPNSNPPSYAHAVGDVPPSSPSIPQQTTATIHNVTVVLPVGAHPTRMICPSCHAEIQTKIQREPGTVAFVSGFIIAVMGGILGCCLIPCCIDECKDVRHTCPQCQAYLGRYQQ